MPRRSITTTRGRRRPLLAPEVANVDYKDVNLLRSFVSERGKIRSRSVTGITPRQQRAVAKAVKNARELALLPYPNRR
ncbi:MAG: 30S ribosomal protein S18 [Nocardioides sp.]